MSDKRPCPFEIRQYVHFFKKDYAVDKQEIIDIINQFETEFEAAHRLSDIYEDLHYGTALVVAERFKKHLKKSRK